jgi:hypothetical protein
MITGNKAPPLGVILFDTAGQKARYGTLLQCASASTVQAALPAVCWNGRKWIPLVHCRADHDSGRGTGKRDLYPKMRPFEEPPTFASHKYAVVEHPYGVTLPFETVSQSLLVIASDQRERGNPFNFDVLRDCFVAWGSSQ